MAEKKPASELKKAYYERFAAMVAPGQPAQASNPLIERLKQAAAGYKPLGKQ